MSTSTTPVSIRILVLGEYPVMRAALRLLIESRPGLMVVGDAANYDEALAVNLAEPDIILIDLDLDRIGNLDALIQMVASVKSARMMILTCTARPEAHSQAVRLGVMGLVRKESRPEVLMKAIEKVHAGEIWVDRAIVARLFDRTGLANSVADDAFKIGTLTQREREIVAVVGEGLRNKQIAERLCISQTTVRHHLTSIFDKLGVSDRLELIIYAYRHNLARPPR